jgi:hypothetical protein
MEAVAREKERGTHEEGKDGKKIASHEGQSCRAGRLNGKRRGLRVSTERSA